MNDGNIYIERPSAILEANWQDEKLLLIQVREYPQVFKSVQGKHPVEIPLIRDSNLLSRQDFEAYTPLLRMFPSILQGRQANTFSAF